MRKLVAGLLLAVGATALPLAAPQPALAAESATAVMLVVDVSGSMAEDDGSGTVKLQGAKNGIGAFLADLPDGTPTGLRTYPSGTGDCGTGKLMWEPQPLHRTRLGAEVRSLKADGGTPTAQALLAAYRDLEAAGHTKATVVLVSDGESNCPKDGPVCTVAEGLQSLGVAVTVNTVGFNISEAGRQELECIAQATGGVYSDVQGAGELADRLSDFAEGRLDLSVDAPQTVRMTVGASDPEGRRVVATVTNPGVAPAVDVRVSLQMTAPTPDGIGSAYIATSQPSRLLGTLEPGGRRTVEWQFRPPLDFSTRTLSYRVLAGPFRGTATEATGEIRVTSEIDLADAGPLLRDKKKVAILGDSYSSGEGAGDYQQGSDTKDNTCHRSANTYAMELFASQPVVLACSGAIAANVTTSHPVHRAVVGTGVLPAQTVQLDRLISSGTVPDLVLMSLGGNDVGFGPIITTCVFGPTDCTDDDNGVVAQAQDKLDGLPQGLAAAYRGVNAVLNSERAIRAREGKVAPIVVMAYPQLFPDALGKAAHCQGHLEADEIAFANQLSRDLNGVIGATVAQLRGADRPVPVYFAADVAEAMLPDHTLCGAVPWVNELLRTKSVAGDLAGKVAGSTELILAGVANPTTPPSAKLFGIAVVGGSAAVEAMSGEELRTYKHAYHPTADGYRAMTAALIRYSGSEDANSAIPKAPPNPLAGARPGPLQGEPIVLQGTTTQVVDLRTGEERTLEVRGLPPGTAIEVVLRSAPVVLAQAVTDADGTARTTVMVPPTMEPGRHELQVTPLEGGEVLVTAPVDVQRTRPWWWMPGGVTSGVFVLTGVGLLGHRRRLRRGGGTP